MKIAFSLLFLLAHFALNAAQTITFTDTGNSVKMTNSAAFSYNIEIPYNAVFIQPVPAQGGQPAYLNFTRLDGTHLMDIRHADVLVPSTANISALHVALAAMYYKPPSASTQTVSGSVSVTNFPSSQNVSVTNWPSFQAVTATALPLPSGAATEAKQDAILSELQAKTEPSNTQQVAGTVGISGTATVAGTVSVDNFPATQAVSGTLAVSNFPATQPVSGSVTATISGTPSVSITGTPTVTLSGTPSVIVANTFATQTITQLTAAGTASAAFDVGAYKCGTVVYKCASLPALGVVSLSLQGSNNGTDWAVIQGVTNISIANANLNGVFEWTVPYQYVRISFDGETLGTTTVVDAVQRASAF